MGRSCPQSPSVATSQSSPCPSRTRWQAAPPFRCGFHPSLPIVSVQMVVWIQLLVQLVWRDSIDLRLVLHPIHERGDRNWVCVPLGRLAASRSCHLPHPTTPRGPQERWASKSGVRTRGQRSWSIPAGLKPWAWLPRVVNRLPGHVPSEQLPQGRSTETSFLRQVDGFKITMSGHFINNSSKASKAVESQAASSVCRAGPRNWKGIPSSTRKVFGQENTAT